MSDSTLRTAIARVLEDSFVRGYDNDYGHGLFTTVNPEELADAVLKVLADQPAKVVERMRENRPTTPPPGYATGSDAAGVRDSLVRGEQDVHISK